MVILKNSTRILSGFTAVFAVSPKKSVFSDSEPVISRQSAPIKAIIQYGPTFIFPMRTSGFIKTDKNTASAVAALIAIVIPSPFGHAFENLQPSNLTDYSTFFGFFQPIHRPFVNFINEKKIAPFRKTDGHKKTPCGKLPQGVRF
jgi:hypothetical protein